MNKRLDTGYFYRSTYVPNLIVSSVYNGSYLLIQIPMRVHTICFCFFIIKMERGLNLNKIQRFMIDIVSGFR